jgi:hypothetical protein
VPGRIPNPWENLPREPPIVAPVDAPLFAQHRSWRQQMTLDVLPSPFLGTSKAPVFVLSGNPSGRDQDSEYGPEFDHQRRRELGFAAEHPYYSLNPRFAHTAGADWHQQMLWQLIAALNPDGQERVARGVFWLQFLGYQAPTWSSFPSGLRELAESGRVPSQAFAFQLVRDAIAARKTIVIGRPGRDKSRWMRCVPELASFDVIVGSNPQRPFITPGNLGTDGFERVVTAIRDHDKEDDDDVG